MKRFFKYACLTLLCLFLLRGWLFRLTVRFEPETERKFFSATDPNLLQSLENQPVDTHLLNVVHKSLELTAYRLNFTAGKNDIDPNALFHTRNTHCVGYAAYFATVCNHLFNKSGISGRYEAKHFRGKAYFLGIDLHRFANHPFFRDHDFNIIEDKLKGVTYHVDASVLDVLGIKYVVK